VSATVLARPGAGGDARGHGEERERHDETPIAAVLLDGCDQLVDSFVSIVPHPGCELREVGERLQRREIAQHD
jgi:hypothetical protein